MSRIEETESVHEYDRPMYFVEIQDGYRCGWFHQAAARLDCSLTRCHDVYQSRGSLPDEADIVGRVVGIVTRGKSLQLSSSIISSSARDIRAKKLFEVVG